MPESRGTGAAALLFLHAQTALHPGSGTALGTVDLPVQRERHTEWPVIPGSALKGVLRDACREAIAVGLPSEGAGSRRQRADETARIAGGFGPARVEGDEAHIGALSVTDARLLAFPVRSLKGVFAWITCPLSLQRLKRDLALAGGNADFTVPEPEPDRAICPKTALCVPPDRLVLEEFDYTIAGDAPDVTAWFAGHVSNDPGTLKRLESHLVVLHDGDFTHYVKHATEVVARVGLDYERKTVKDGALFYQEFLPAETIFYSVVLAGPSRRKDDRTTAQEWLGYLRQTVPSVIQVGGDATVGKGLCSIRWSEE